MDPVKFADLLAKQSGWTCQEVGETRTHKCLRDVGGVELPVSATMRSSWLMVEVPGKRGLLVKSSPSIQPAMHRSHHKPGADFPCHSLLVF